MRKLNPFCPTNHIKLSEICWGSSNPCIDWIHYSQWIQNPYLVAILHTVKLLHSINISAIHRKIKLIPTLVISTGTKVALAAIWVGSIQSESTKSEAHATRYAPKKQSELRQLARLDPEQWIHSGIRYIRHRSYKIPALNKRNRG